jgi:hypothetical protein
VLERSVLSPLGGRPVARVSNDFFRLGTERFAVECPTPIAATFRLLSW